MTDGRRNLENVLFINAAALRPGMAIVEGDGALLEISDVTPNGLKIVVKFHAYGPCRINPAIYPSERKIAVFTRDGETPALVGVGS